MLCQPVGLYFQRGLVTSLMADDLTNVLRSCLLNKLFDSSLQILYKSLKHANTAGQNQNDICLRILFKLVVYDIFLKHLFSEGGLHHMVFLNISLG